MSGKGNCYDNSAVETFFKSIKAELIWRRTWLTRRQTETAIFQYINGFYSPRRRHSAMAGKSPLAFERQVAQKSIWTGTNTQQDHYALQPSIPHLTRSALHRCMQRKGIARLPDVEGDMPRRQKFKRYPICFFHIDIAEEGKLFLFVGIDRTSKFAVAQLVATADRTTAREFLQHMLESVPYRVHTILTDYGIQFAEQPRNRITIYSRQMRFDMICEANGIEHRLTKPKRKGMDHAEIGIGALSDEGKAKPAKKTARATGSAASKDKSEAEAFPAVPVTPSKLDQLAALLRAPGGASLPELQSATGWQVHSVRGAMAGALRKKGYSITSEMPEGGLRRYWIAEAS